MQLGYNTNGFAHHKLEDALQIIAELGYTGVALTPDVHHLNPFDPDIEVHLGHCREGLESTGLQVVIETGARFILSPWRKHQPTLLSPTPQERQVRFDFLAKSCLRMAERLGAKVLSFWSGAVVAHDDAKPMDLMARLVEQCRVLADAAAKVGVQLAFEPEPGMFIDTMPKYEELHDRVNHPAFGLTLDVGHLVCQQELPIHQHIQRWQAQLWNIHLDDMLPNIHDHLQFGQGSVNFNDVFRSLKEIGFTGLASVELSRHSHDAVNTARSSLAFLRQQTAGDSPER